MSLDRLDSSVISKLITHQVERVTCIECCRYYIAPETAPCSHSLCHGCWTGRRECPCCKAPVTRRTLKPNAALRAQTEHIHILAEAFEKVFDVKLDELEVDTLGNKLQSNDPTKHVKEWLASSHNYFSASVVSSQTSPIDVPAPIELNASKIQIHSCAKKVESPMKVLQQPTPQEDWDKIETLPDTEDICAKNKENIVGPMDIEPYFFDENEYSNEHPRRSNRKLGMKTAPRTARNKSADKMSSKNSESETEKQSKTKQDWSNVKKMKKEFNKLNKANKNKLNVSIEMCKKAQLALPPKTAKNVVHSTIDDAPDNPEILDKENVDDENTPEKNYNDIVGLKVRLSEEQTEKYRKGPGSGSKVGHGKVMHKLPIIKRPTSINKSKSNETKASNTTANEKQSSTDDLPSSSNVGEPATAFHMPFFQRSALHSDNNKGPEVHVVHNEVDPDCTSTNTDDVQISIKIGSTITNIVIKQKQKDVTLKVNADSAIQTSLGPYNLPGKEMCDKGINAQASLPKEMSDKETNVHLIELEIGDQNKVSVKSNTVKLNTDSADTVTPQYDITESVEKEMSDVMDAVENVEQEKGVKQPKAANVTRELPSPKPSQAKSVEARDDTRENIDDINDLDLFASGSVKEANVHLLKNTKVAQSEILEPTLKRSKTQKVPDKRDRDVSDDAGIEMPTNKKQKVSQDEKMCPEKEMERIFGQLDTEPTYDKLMSQVFASIDADIQDGKSANNTQKQKRVEKECPKNESQILHKTQKRSTPKEISPRTEAAEVVDLRAQQKDSENVFSLMENEPQEVTEKSHHITEKPPEPPITNTQQNIENLLTPGVCRDFRTITQPEQMDVEMVPLQPPMGTPLMDDDDSDKSVVEETPQKNISFQKPKPKGDPPSAVHSNEKPHTITAPNKGADENKASHSQSIINITDTLTPGGLTKNATVVENMAAGQKGQSLETPLTISRFVNHIKHNSTPVARKSLNFEGDGLDDPEQTLCPTTTQEKEFMAKAFEKTPSLSPVKKPLPLGLRNVTVKNTKKYCLAGSCLSAPELIKIRQLCRSRGWTFADKYTDQLTHLVVAVDADGKSQRTVKYMCALAASKWIVSYEWVEKCLSGGVPDETAYEVLDACGHRGPTHSRLAPGTLFKGMVFYCMPPFSVLDVDNLKHMVTAAGGRVATSPADVKVTGGAVRLLLAEPETTQEDRFTYLAMEKGIVPVNYEWVLNCLGMYRLCSIKDLLLCPFLLLPKPVTNWPPVLFRDSEGIDEDEGGDDEV